MQQWEPVEALRHRFQPPVYVGNDLVAVRWEDANSQFAVWRGEQRIFTIPLERQPAGNEVKRLASWEGHWVLEVEGDVYIDGTSLSNEMGYDEVFGWQLVEGRPLYFFRKGSRIGLSYDGRALPYQYEQMPHDLCCETASLNVAQNEFVVSFYGLRRGVWYWVEIGATSEAAGLPSGLESLRRQVSFPVFVPTAVPAELAPESPRQRETLVEVGYRTRDGEVGLHVLNGPAGCCLDADPRKTGERIRIRGGIAGHFLVNQPEFGGPILWWVEDGTYIALSGPHLTKDALVQIAESMSPTADLHP